MSGQIVHFEIPADDTTKGREFWGSLFGWQFQGMPGPFEYYMTQLSEQTGGAITDMEPGKRGLRVYFDVDDINAGAARVKELGGEANEPSPVETLAADDHRSSELRGARRPPRRGGGGVSGVLPEAAYHGPNRAHAGL